MANTDVDIYSRCRVKLPVGVGPGAALCRAGTLQCRSFLALFCRQFRRWNHGADNNGSWPGPTASMGLVQTAASFRVSRNVNRGVASGCTGRSDGAAPLWAMGVHGKYADRAWYRRCPDRANALSSAADIPDSRNMVLQYTSISLIISRKRRRNYESTQSFTIHGGCYGFCIGC
jgi:hypothetical protein